MGEALNVNALVKGLQRTIEIEQYLTRYFDQKARGIDVRMF